MARVPWTPGFCWTSSKVTQLPWALAAHLYCSATPLLVAERLRESESVWYTVTCSANMSADLYGTMMRINPEYYGPLGICLRCRGFLHFAIFPTPHWVGWIHLNKVWGKTSGGWGCRTDGGKASYWLMLVHPKHQLLSLLLKLIHLSGWVTRKYMYPGNENAAWSPPVM